MKPPTRNTNRRVRDPQVLAMIIVLQTAEMSLKSPAAVCWNRNTNNSCLKNLSMGLG